MRNTINIEEMYVLRKSGTKKLYHVQGLPRTTENVKWAKTFELSNDAIDYMLQHQLLDDFDLIKIGDLNAI